MTVTAYARRCYEAMMRLRVFNAHPIHTFSNGDRYFIRSTSAYIISKSVVSGTIYQGWMRAVVESSEPGHPIALATSTSYYKDATYSEYES